MNYLIEIEITIRMQQQKETLELLENVKILLPGRDFFQSFRFVCISHNDLRSVRQVR